MGVDRNELVAGSSIRAKYGEVLPGLRAISVGQNFIVVFCPLGASVVIVNVVKWCLIPKVGSYAWIPRICKKLGIGCIISNHFIFLANNGLNNSAAKSSCGLVHLDKHTTGSIAFRVDIDICIAIITPRCAPGVFDDDKLVAISIRIIAHSQQSVVYNIRIGIAASTHVSTSSVFLKVGKNLKWNGYRAISKSSSEGDTVGYNLFISGQLKCELVQMVEWNFSLVKQIASSIGWGGWPLGFWINSNSGNGFQGVLDGTTQLAARYFMGVTVGDGLKWGDNVTCTCLDAPGRGSKIGSSSCVIYIADIGVNVSNRGNNSVISPVNGSGVFVEGRKDLLVAIGNVSSRSSLTISPIPTSIHGTCWIASVVIGIECKSSYAGSADSLEISSRTTVHHLDWGASVSVT